MARKANLPQRSQFPSFFTIILSSVCARAFALALIVFSIVHPACANDYGNDTETKLRKDIETLGSGPLALHFTTYRETAASIRDGTIKQCISKLSSHLELLGPVMGAQYGAAAGALTLLPTAGALIGAPAKELWILFKLVPIAGVLSMMLSLGGNIVPGVSDEYETSSYTYGGLIGTSPESQQADTFDDALEPSHAASCDPRSFAKLVQRRANDPFGSSKRQAAVIGTSLQFVLILLIVTACYLTEVGSIVTWWCKSVTGSGLDDRFQGWYFFVIVGSLLENLAGVPFSKQWTVRVSRAPSSIGISEDAPAMFPDDQFHLPTTDLGNDSQKGGSRSTMVGSTTYEEISLRNLDLHNTEDGALEAQKDNHRSGFIRHQTNLLESLKRHGLNTTGRVVMDRSKPWSAGRHSFLVIISVRGISHQRAAARVMSKAFSVAVFVGGTVLFASATLIYMYMAIIALSLVLGAGVFGRVASMWMVSKFMEDKPILHRVVKSQGEADQFMYEILNSQGLMFELEGHVFINGRCVKRCSRWWSWSTIFGILARPYSLERILQS